MVPESDNVDVRDPKAVAERLKCPLAAKQFGFEDVLAPLIAKACISVCPGNPVNFNVDNVRTVKIPGADASSCARLSTMAPCSVCHCSIALQFKPYPVAPVDCCAHGNAGAVMTDSTVVPGMVLKRAAEGSVTSVKDCKVAVYAQVCATAMPDTIHPHTPRTHRRPRPLNHATVLRSVGNITTPHVADNWF